MFNNNMNIDPMTSFSNDPYYTLNSYLIHPQYLSPPSTHHPQSLSIHSVYFQSDPFDDIDEENQNQLLPQNHLHSHDNINNILQLHYSKPSFMRESAEKITSAVLVLPESTSLCNPTNATGDKFMKGKSPAPNHDDHHQQQLLISRENFGGKKPVPPADHHHVQLQSNIPRKRGSSFGGNSSSNGKNKKRKDRHSKILITPTTRPRHRRMRLSIDVAREFFDLQDMLGFERASKTVEWLLIKAKPDIDKLRELNNRGSCSTSTSSGLDEEGMNASGDQSGEAAGSGTSCKPARIKEKKKKYTRSKTSKRIVINPLAREQRERARERARERTREKMINNKRVEMNINNNINPSSSSLDQAVLHLVSSCDHDHNHYQHHQHYDDQFDREPSLIVANTNGWNNLRTSTSTSAAFVDDESCNSNLVNNIHDMGGNLWNPSLVATNSLNNVVSAAATTTTTATATATAAFGIPQQHQFSFFGNWWEGCNSQSLGFPET